MKDKKNFLIGFGERLTERIVAPRNKINKIHPYTLQEARKRLTPKMEAVYNSIENLPEIITPENKVVAAITMHPAYQAKSYYPGNLLKAFGFESVGSKSVEITPEKWGKKTHSDKTKTTEIFISGPKNNFKNIISKIKGLEESSPLADDVIKIEDFHIIETKDKIKKIVSKSDEILLEVVLHASGLQTSNYILDGFKKYVESLGIKINLDKRLHADGLCFLPLKVKKTEIENVAKYTFLRLVREMPNLRPLTRSTTSSGFKCVLPDTPCLDPNIKVAIFDGGVPDYSPMSKWVNNYDASNISNPVNGCFEHGMGVTSAFLFGPINEGELIERPYANVDHYRVLDDSLKNDGTEFDVLVRIRDILKSRQYEFVNISLGPDLPVEDDDVHAWTSVLDDIFSKGNIFTTVAAGNSGLRDWPSGNARIQPPGDCVNALTVGSSDTNQKKWKRASYSSIGPGRSPGVVKPDVLAFGGSSSTSFGLLDSNNFGYVRTDMQGTSFASPYALRTAVGIKSYFGSVLTPLALKALLINCAERNGDPKYEIGWGKIPSEIEEIVLTDDSTARIVFQGSLSPSEWVKFPIPVPADALPGKVKISATLCFASMTNPQDPVNYTMSGLEIRFRPHEDIRKEVSQLYPDSKPFFKASELYGETDCDRSDAHKWETTLSSSKNMYGKGLKNPTFNIHYNARDCGNTTNSGIDIPYALVITVSAPKCANLYNKIVNRYRTHLEILKPVIQIPIVV